jgi:hypothetical protein
VDPALEAALEIVTARGHRDASLQEEVPQTLQRAGHAFLRRFVTNPECFRHLPRRLALEVTQKKSVPIGLAQFIQPHIQMRRDLFPGDIRLMVMGEHFVHGSGLLFAGASAHLGANGLGGDVLRHPMQPSRNHGASSQSLRVPRQSHKRPLSDILGQVGIADHSPGSRIDQVNVAPDEFRKCRLRLVRRVIVQQLLVGHVFQSEDSSRHRKNRTALNAHSPVAYGGLT